MEFDDGTQDVDMADMEDAGRRQEEEEEDEEEDYVSWLTTPSSSPVDDAAKRQLSERLMADLNATNLRVGGDDFGDAKTTTLRQAGEAHAWRWKSVYAAPELYLWLRPEAMDALAHARLRVTLPIMPWRNGLGNLVKRCILPQAVDAASAASIRMQEPPDSRLLSLIEWFAGHTAYNMLHMNDMLWVGFKKAVWSIIGFGDPLNPPSFYPYGPEVRRAFLGYCVRYLDIPGAHLAMERTKPQMLRLLHLATLACQTMCPALDLMPPAVQAVLAAMSAGDPLAIQCVDMTLLVGTWELLQSTDRSRDRSYIDTPADSMES